MRAVEEKLGIHGMRAEEERQSALTAALRDVTTEELLKQSAGLAAREEITSGDPGLETGAQKVRELTMEVTGLTQEQRRRKFLEDNEDRLRADGRYPLDPDAYVREGEGYTGGLGE